MSAIDGRFNKELKLKDLNRNVEAAGILDAGFEELDLTLHVVVIDKAGVVAEIEQRDPELELGEKPEERTWTLTAPATDAMQAGPGIAYATALGTGPEGIKSWQWHSVVVLEVAP
jgi:hypothetical protein